MHDLIPLGTNILVEAAKEAGSITHSGLVLPETLRKKPTAGVIAFVGYGQIRTIGKHGRMYIPPLLSKGQRVLFHRHAGRPVVYNKREYLLLREEDIFLVFEGTIG